MKLASSNIGLTPYDHRDELRKLPAMGLAGLEVALSRVWKENWNHPSLAEVESYRRMVEGAGLKIVGLHSLFWREPDLTLFGDRSTRNRTLDFLERLSEVCRDLGGRTLIYGSRTARTRGRRSMPDATAQAVDFFGDLCRRVETHGTCFCIEPLEAEVADYVNSVLESLVVVEAVNHPAMRVQVDVKALAAQGEADLPTLRAVAACLVHVHANEPDLGVLGSSGDIDHAAMGGLLREIGYDGYVSIEQRLLNPADPLADVAKSAAELKECYS